MLYHAYQAYTEASEPVRAMARVGLSFGRLFPSLAELPYGRNLSAALELLVRAKLTHTRPPYAIDKVVVAGREVTVREEVTAALPFCDLIHFAKDDVAPQPKMLVVAPLSGHFATLLRNTVETLSRDHDVYITDWRNARDISTQHGPFGFDEVPGDSGSGRACPGGLPTLCAGFGRGGADVGRQKSGAAAIADLDGGADRYAHPADQGQ